VIRTEKKEAVRMFMGMNVKERRGRGRFKK